MSPNTIYFNNRCSNNTLTVFETEIVKIFQMFLNGIIINNMFLKHYNTYSLSDKMRVFMLKLLLENVYISSNVDNDEMTGHLTKQHMFFPVRNFDYNLVDYLRNKRCYNNDELLRSCYRYMKHKLGEKKPYKKVFINERKRHTVCDAEIKKPLEEFMKYECVYVEDLNNVSNLVDLFREATIVVSGNENILENLLFSTNECLICELKMKNHKKSRNEEMCEILGKQYMRYDIDDYGVNGEYLVLHKRLLKYIGEQ